MKKIISCLLLIILVFGICSCAQVAEEEEFTLDLNGMNGDFSKTDFTTRTKKVDNEKPRHYTGLWVDF